MKKILFLLVLSFMTVSASAQITWNVKAGFGVAHCFGGAKDLSPVFATKVGVGIEKPFTPNWSLMPSIECAYKGASEKWTWGNESSKINLTLLYLQIPIMAAYRVNINDSWNTTFKAGPYIGYAIMGQVHGPGRTINYFSKDNDNSNRFDLGLDLGIDFEYHRFVFGVEYELGFIPFQKDPSLYNGAFYATVGYKF